MDHHVSLPRDGRTIIVIGSSTGGARTLEIVFSQFPLVDAAVILVQHMPHSMNSALCHHIEEISFMKVRIPEDGEEIIPAVDVSKMDPRNVRQVVNYRTSYAPGTIVVDPYARLLYLVMEDDKAMRYGVGVAKAGLEFEGEGIIKRKARWPGCLAAKGRASAQHLKLRPMRAC